MESMVMQSDLLARYQNKKVFITGHTGFKGAWLMACLHQAGATLKGYALTPAYEGLFSLLEPLQLAESIIADIRDKERLESELLAFQPEIIFHLAAQPLVRRSYEIPAETFDVNVTGTANLLEAVTRLKGPCSIVVITTDKVYQNKEQNILYVESDLLGGYDPYSASKACAELVVSSFRNSFFDPTQFATHQKAIASARAGNVIGGGDWGQDRIMPDIIRSLQTGQQIQVRNPDAVRPWQFVLEPLFGYLQLGLLLSQDPVSFSKAYNFGPEQEDHLTVRELVTQAIRSWGNGEWVNMAMPGQPHEAGLLKLAIGLAKKELHWQPKLKARDAIDWTVQWYREPLASRIKYSFEQVKNYFAI